MRSVTELVLPGSWIKGQDLDTALQNPGDLLFDPERSLVVRVTPASKVMVDAAVRLLSILNQHASTGRRVSVIFESGAEEAMSYLNRIGFFDCLAAGIEIEPTQPRLSRARVFAGSSKKVVEVRPISPRNRHSDLPSDLADRLEIATSCRADSKALGHAAYTILGELIDNIFEHSSTELDGYAALQVYTGGNEVLVAVSDSGIGLVDSLRPALHGTPFQALSEVGLVMELFRRGISRFGPERGCGLPRCAAHAIKYSATLDVRLPTSFIKLSPGSEGYNPVVARCRSGLPLIRGTHYGFHFLLH